MQFLFTERYLEFRSQMGKKSAVIETVAVVTPSVLTSGTVLAVVGFLLGYISSHGILSQLGIFIGRGSLLSLFIVLFVLPGAFVPAGWTCPAHNLTLAFL